MWKTLFLILFAFEFKESYFCSGLKWEIFPMLYSYVG